MAAAFEYSICREVTCMHEKRAKKSFPFDAPDFLTRQKCFDWRARGVGAKARNFWLVVRLGFGMKHVVAVIKFQTAYCLVTCINRIYCFYDKILVRFTGAVDEKHDFQIDGFEQL